MVDIIVLGATGFTGRLITRYLHAHKERQAGKFTYAIAGRSKSKLQDLAAAIKSDAADDLEIYQVDVTNFEDVERTVQKCRVVINAVGPYWRWGKPVVKACARHGIHYVDLTGETPFVQDIIAEFDYLACKTHAVIIPSCGFDSMPSDIVVYLSAKTLKKAAGASATIAESHTSYKLRGGASGGTMSTAISIFEEIPRQRLMEAYRPYSLSPITGPRPNPRKYVHTLPYSSPKKYGFNFPLAPHNKKIVQRSWGLFQLRATSASLSESSAPKSSPMAYGMEFKYEEYMHASNPLFAFMIGLGLAFGQLMFMMFPPARWLFKLLATPSGQGPSDDSLANGFMSGTNITFSTPSESGKRTVVKTVMTGTGDPGYTLTAIMISEAGLALLNKSELPQMAQEGGVLTPVTALGDTLIERLERSARFEFESQVLSVN